MIVSGPDCAMPFANKGSSCEHANEVKGASGHGGETPTRTKFQQSQLSHMSNFVDGLEVKLGARSGMVTGACENKNRAILGAVGNSANG